MELRGALNSSIEFQHPLLHSYHILLILGGQTSIMTRMASLIIQLRSGERNINACIGRITFAKRCLTMYAQFVETCYILYGYTRWYKATISSYLPKPWNIVKLNNPLCRIEIFNLSFFVLKTSFRLISNNSSKYLDINFMMKTGVYVEYNRFLSRKNFFKGMKRTKQYLFICFE